MKTSFVGIRNREWLHFKRWGIFIVFTILLTPIVLFYFVCYQIDTEEKHRTLRVIESGFNSAIKTYEKVIKDYALWDQMYTNTFPVINDKWAWEEGNLGSGLYREYSINGVFILDKNYNTIYSVLNGKKEHFSLANLARKASFKKFFSQECGRNNSLTMIKGETEGRPIVIYCHRIINPLSRQNISHISTTLVFIKFFKADEVISLGNSVDASNLKLNKISNPHSAETIRFGNTVFGAVWDYRNSGRHIFYRTLPSIFIFYLLVITGGYILLSKIKQKDSLLAEMNELVNNNQLALYLSENKIKEITELAVILFAHLKSDLAILKIETNTFSQDYYTWNQCFIYEKIAHDNISVKDWMLNIEGYQPKTLSGCYLENTNKEKVFVNLTAKKNEGNENAQYSIVLTDISAFINEEKERANCLISTLPDSELSKKVLNAITHNIADNNKTILVCLSVRNLTFISTVYGNSFTNDILKRIIYKINDFCSTYDFVAKLESGNILCCLQFVPVQEGYDEAWKSYVTNLINNIQLSLRNNTESITPVICAGCLMYDDENNDVVTALKFLEIAHSESKEINGDNIIFSNTDNIKKHEDRLKMMTLITEAIENDNFSLVYQPKYNFNMSSISGVEALIRWSHKEYGFISPAQFIPVAEKSDLIFRITDWVIKSVFLLSSKMQTITFSINLSGKDFDNPDLFNQIERYLNLYNTNPENITFEITEGVIISNPASVRRTLLLLKEKGFNIHIDDFGTGYSSLGYLREFPFNAIKIERSFIKDIEKNEQDARIVKSIISLGKAFNLQVIAEGVETVKQFTILKNMGCDEVQGYYYSRPLDRENLTHFLSNQ